MCISKDVSDTSNKPATYKCDHFGKSGHTAYCDVKPYCRALVTELKKKKEMVTEIIIDSTTQENRQTSNVNVIIAELLDIKPETA